MKISRLLILAAALAVSSFAFSQSLPPPSYAGQNYWFGPGPATYSLSSTSQDTGGYAEMTYTTAWTTGVSGGPAYQGHISAGSLTQQFGLTSDLTVLPYIYIDGYFGTQASISGYTGQNVAAGTSRFFILHNVPVEVSFSNFTSFEAAGRSPILVHYGFQLFTYDTLALIRAGGFDGDLGLTYTTSVDNSLDNGVLQVDCLRIALLNSNTPSDTYTATGQVTVTVF